MCLVNQCELWNFTINKPLTSTANPLESLAASILSCVDTPYQ